MFVFAGLLRRGGGFASVFRAVREGIQPETGPEVGVFGGEIRVNGGKEPVSVGFVSRLLGQGTGINDRDFWIRGWG